MTGDGQSRFTICWKPIFHFVRNSTFSEYTVIHVGCLAKINLEAPPDKVCVLSCGISTGLGATLNVAKPKKGSMVAIIVLGAVGLALSDEGYLSSTLYYCRLMRIIIYNHDRLMYVFTQLGHGRGQDGWGIKDHRCGLEHYKIRTRTK